MTHREGRLRIPAEAPLSTKRHQPNSIGPDPIVIGTGPCGLAVTRVLVSRGLRPIVVDAGRDLDRQRNEVVERMRSTTPDRWSPADTAVLRARPVRLQRDPLPRHWRFGSHDVYDDQSTEAPLRLDSAHAPVPSRALGGFSTVWSGAVLPADVGDLRGWPARCLPTARHYRRAAEMLPLAAADDDLSAAFPLHRRPTGPVPIDASSAHLLTRLRGAAADHDPARVLVGRNRMAVETAPEAADACRSCGLCHFSCVYGSIWSSADDIRALARSGSIDHRAGLRVRTIEHRDGATLVHASDGQRGHTISGSKVYLAAGAIGSTRIVLESLGLWQRPVLLRSTQGFVITILPLQTRRRQQTPTSLAPIAVLLRSGPDAPWSYTQVGPPNPLALERIRSWVPPERAGRAAASLADRSIATALVNLHSDLAGHHELSLLPGGEFPTLQIRSRPGAAFPAAERGTARFLRRLFRAAGALAVGPVGPMTEPEPISWHIGGSLPMVERPTRPVETDHLGRVGGLTGVHVVDAATFPSVPATTPTLLGMANAIRIADETALRDPRY